MTFARILLVVVVNEKLAPPPSPVLYRSSNDPLRNAESCYRAYSKRLMNQFENLCKVAQTRKNTMEGISAYVSFNQVSLPADIVRNVGAYL